MQLRLLMNVQYSVSRDRFVRTIRDERFEFSAQITEDPVARGCVCSAGM